MKFRTILTLALGAIIMLGALPSHSAYASGVDPNPGAIFTTDSACVGTNVNIFDSKDAVYLDGGPKHSGAAGLPDGLYYVQVTEPNGTPLGTSLSSANETPVTVSAGEFAQCYQLSAILIKASDGSPGYDDTSNPGGEYKVWVSMDPTFTNSNTKTDNFKVRESAQSGTVDVRKFYDTNANGVFDGADFYLTGWKVNIHDDINWDRYTPVHIVVDAPDDYTVSEYAPVETNWTASTATTQVFHLDAGASGSVTFGNYCTVASGGLTLGFWSNKNGQALVTSADLAFLNGLSLRNANGSTKTFSNAKDLSTWLLNATATNMAYMLSAQLATMELNVRHGFVQATSYYIPAGETIAALMAEAINGTYGLVTYGNTVATGAARTWQEQRKTWLDQLNNGASVVPLTACAFSFAP